MYIYAERNFVTFCKANYSVPFDSSLAFKQKIIVIFHATKSVFLPVLEDFSAFCLLRLIFHLAGFFFISFTYFLVFETAFSRISMSTVSFLAQLDSGILCL